MAELEDTQPLDLRELLEALGDDPSTPENEVEVVRKRMPEPALVRGGILALINLAAVLFGIQINAAWVEPAMYVYGVVGPVVLALWIRRNVTPVKGRDS